METKLKVDGEDTGVKLDLDLNYIFKAVMVAMVIGCGTMLWSANDKLNTIGAEAALIKYQIQLIQEKQTTFATLDQITQMAKLRDMQLATIEARISALESKVKK